MCRLIVSQVLVGFLFVSLVSLIDLIQQRTVPDIDYDIQKSIVYWVETKDSEDSDIDDHVTGSVNYDR